MINLNNSKKMMSVKLVDNTFHKVPHESFMNFMNSGSSHFKYVEDGETKGFGRSAVSSFEEIPEETVKLPYNVTAPESEESKRNRAEILAQRKRA